MRILYIIILFISFTIYIHTHIYIYMNECLFKHKNNVGRSLLCKQKYKITKTHTNINS